MDVRLKVCGITRVQDLELCDELGVYAVGINLWSGSKRGLSVPQARALLAADRHRLQRVGVFVHAESSTILAAFKALELDAVQVHDETPIAQVAAMGLPYVWVVRGTPGLDSLVVPSPAPTWVLLDAAVAGYGGEGVRTDWTWAAQAVQALAPARVWLAGGIRPDNACAAVTQVAPAGLDVASGVELAGAVGGHKDRDKLRRLLAAAGCRAMT